MANSLVYRYNVEHSNDGLDGDEGTFNICTFRLPNAWRVIVGQSRFTDPWFDHGSVKHLVRACESRAAGSDVVAV